MDEIFSRPASPAPVEGKSLWWWVAAGGIVVAGAGALYLFSRTKRGRRTRKDFNKKMKQVKGGLLVAVLAGFANKAGSAAAGKVL